MDENQARDNVKGALYRNEELFDPSSKCILRNREMPEKSNDGDKNYLTFYHPYRIDFDSVGGYKLKDNKGYISLAETYLVINTHKLELVAFSYKFISGEVQYTCTNNICGQEGQKKKINYNFRYDKDLIYQQSNDNQHPPFHLQVLHNHPRFSTDTNITPDIFLKLIEGVCFKNRDLEPYAEPIYLI